MSSKHPKVSVDNLYLPVSLACLKMAVEVPCDVYIKNAENTYVLLVKAGGTFVSSDRTNLIEHGVEDIYVHQKDDELYFSAIKHALEKIVKNPLTTPRAKAEALRATCHETMAKAFREPRGAFIRQAESIISPTVDFIVSDKEATKNLMLLTSHDNDTYVHSLNVGIYAIGLAKMIYGDDGRHDLYRLANGFFFHDLGKCRVPLEILNEPGPLSDEQREIIRTHPEAGYRLLKQEGLVTEEARIITLQHHERDNGTGYPFGLKGEDVHPYARICRLADIYEALTSDRPYHERRTPYEALKYMKDSAVVDMDPELLRHFIELFI